jgi:enhancing lycopene biosynthesis protein 2
MGKRNVGRVAVVLCGSGRADGSEIHESVACLVHLARLGATYRCFAPDEPQAEVVNHLTGKATGETRNQLVEAARIARGEISPLSTLREQDFDAIVFPGGTGAAKNLCTFAKDGAALTVHADVERLLRAFHGAGKPIGMCCIAPVMGAKVLGTNAGGPGVAVTIGHDEAVAAAIGQWGSRNVPRGADEAETDGRNRVVTSPAYMDAKATPHQVFEGIGRMIESVVELMRSRV